jgi:hypothetical protein
MKALITGLLFVTVTAQADTCTDFADVAWMYAERGRQGAGIDFKKLDELQADTESRLFIMKAYEAGAAGQSPRDVWQAVYTACTAREGEVTL